jgi:hypothetical protein
VFETKPEGDLEEQKQRSKDLNTTPKPSNGFDVHNTTILEENETMRASMDKHPTLARKKRSNHFAEDGVPMSATLSNAQGSMKKGKLIKGIRTKSSVSGIGID